MEVTGEPRGVGDWTFYMLKIIFNLLRYPSSTHIILFFNNINYINDNHLINEKLESEMPGRGNNKHKYLTVCWVMNKQENGTICDVGGWLVRFWYS